MEGPLLRLHILFRSVNKHGCHRKFLFLIGWFLKNLLLWNHFAKWNERWATQPQPTEPLVLFCFCFYIKVCLKEISDDFGGSKMIKMNEILFIFSHSERVKCKGNLCPNFLLKGGLDDIYFEGMSRLYFGVQEGSKCSKGMKCFCFQPFWKNSNIMWTAIQISRKGVYMKFLWKGVSK